MTLSKVGYLLVIPGVYVLLRDLAMGALGQISQVGLGLGIIALGVTIVLSKDRTGQTADSNKPGQMARSKPLPSDDAQRPVAS